MIDGYHRMSLADKQAHSRRTQAEPSVVCPICEVQTTARDLLDHQAKRCTGQRDPHPCSAWVSWPEAIALGVTKWTLSRWVTAGDVRMRGEIQCRRYLLRDIVTRMASKRRRR